MYTYEQLSTLTLFGILPVLTTFIIERWFVFLLASKPNFAEWVGSKKWLTPNTISRMRYPTGILSVLIYEYISPGIGIYFFSFWMISDVTDGSIARYCNLYSKAGETIDPLSDKLLYFPPLFYAAYLGYFSLWFVLIFLFFDVLGQVSRSFTENTAANLFGKAKTFLTVITLMMPFVQEVYLDGYRHQFGDLLLIGTCFLAFCSMFFRVIPNYWYANILSLLNLLCGVIGISLIIFGYPTVFSFMLVFLGQFLDLFDGRAADRWGSTPRGEVFDDLADGVNFGGTISFIIFASFENLWLSIPLGLLHSICTIYRLIRFIQDKKQQGETSGTLIFNGLPSPAGALLNGSAVLLISYFPFEWNWFDSDILKIIYILIGCFLMISHFPYVHFGRVILPSIPRMVRVLFYTGILILLLISAKIDRHAAFLILIHVFVLLYVFFGIRIKKTQAKIEF